MSPKPTPLASWFVLVLLCGSAAWGVDAPGEKAPPPPPAGPVPLDRSAAKMTVPDGFKVTLFAGEPDVRQPIAFTIDPKGRLWVAESFSYPNWMQPAVENDRILILEDSDGDGRYDRRTVFWDKGGKVSNVSGIALGFGGVWVCATPNLLFIPDANGDDKADGPPVVALDGWDEKARHNIFNALNWGPDGWLYGCNGILSNSRVGVPGTPDAARVALNCGVWRFHPTKKTFEAFAHGTTNPWGLDFDDYGEAFITNCVIPHLFHAAPGAHFQRMFGQDILTYSFGLIPSVADHIHWAGGSWTDSRGGTGKHGEAGGGHAHVGAMIYLGDNWPDRYRNSVFTCNLHGHRLNNDTLERSGSGYVARHGKDFLFANDDWFRGLELKSGPDGGVFLTDWTDTAECHDYDADMAHRDNGRIYKVVYGNVAAKKVDLAALSDDELVSLQVHKNDWYVRTARRILQERAAAGKDMTSVHRSLKKTLAENAEVTRKLRAVWALHATNGLSQADLIGLLDHPSEYLRGWGIRLLSDQTDPGADALGRFAVMAKSDPSPWVRLALASALRLIPLEKRWAIAEALISHSEDAGDAYLPLMAWYSIEPAIVADPVRAIGLLENARIGLLRQYISRRLVLLDDPSLSRIVGAMVRTKDATAQADMLDGVLEALRARKAPPIPADWPAAFETLAASANPQVRERSRLVALRLDDPKAVALLREIAAGDSAPADERARALTTLVEKRVPGLSTTLVALLSKADMCGPAIRGIAAYDDPGAFREVVKRYASFTPEQRSDAIQTLASRSASALVLLEAVERGTIAPRELSATTARQLLAFNDKGISEKLEKVWGSIRPTSRQKVELVAKYKGALSPAVMQAADASRGRAVFNAVCLQCHRLYDSGGDVGPDITGSDRANLDYVLENVLDPSAQVARDYRLTTVGTADGRLLSGIVREANDRAVVLQTVNERLTLPRNEIEAMKESNSSMMPEGMLEKLSPEELRDLVGYLASKRQVPLPAGSAKP